MAMANRFFSPCPPQTKQSGAGLLEVLVALVITAIGLLGIAGLHVKAQHAEMESYQRSQALILLQDMVHRMRANRSGRSEYPETLVSDSDFADTDSCDLQGARRAEADISCWHNLLAGASERQDDSTNSTPNSGGIIGGLGCISGNGEDFFVTVAWQGLTDIKATSNDPRTSNSCGAGRYGSEGLRRMVSAHVRFSKPD
jgi:type IV pilus assembly protein PilV